MAPNTKYVDSNDASGKKHRATIFATTDGPATTLHVQCDACAGAELVLPTVHVPQLARVLALLTEKFHLGPDTGIADIRTANKPPPDEG